jgi:predicted phosphoribosyltransferase
MKFHNREHAGRLLAERLSADYRNENVLVLGIPRGAMPMAEIIAKELGGELDVVLVHKLGAPGQPELAVGAVDESGEVLLSEYGFDVEPAYLEAEKQAQLAVLKERRQRYTPNRAPIDTRDRIVIVVDDGIATGSTMMAALRAIRRQSPKKLVAAVGVASSHAASALSKEADEVVCLLVARHFYAVGQFFEDFSQVSDDDVIAVFQRHKPRGLSAS